MKNGLTIIFLAAVFISSCSPPASCQEQVRRFNEELIGAFNEFQNVKARMEEGQAESSNELFDQMHELQNQVDNLEAPACAGSAEPTREALLAYMKTAENFFVQAMIHINSTVIITDEELRQRAQDVATALQTFVDRFTAHQEWGTQLGVEKTFATKVPVDTNILVTSEWPVVLLSAFDDNIDGWPVGETSEGASSLVQSIDDGTYQWTVKAAQGAILTSYPKQGEGADFYLQVDAQLKHGPANATFGIVFRGSEKELYIFVVNDQGEFSVAVHKNGWKPLVNWTKTPRYRLGEKNRLAVSAKEDFLEFFINNHHVGSVRDNRIQSGYLGLMVNPSAGMEAQFEFDNFEVRSSDVGLLIGYGIRLAERGKISEALSLFEKIQKENPNTAIQAGDWNDLCWLGSVWNQAARVMDACELAIKLDPVTGYHYGSRGLARAITGDLKGAADDLRLASEWWKTNQPERGWHQRMQTWVAELEAGHNPFNEQLLTELRAE